MSFKTTGAVQHRNWNLFLLRDAVTPLVFREMYFDAPTFTGGGFTPLADFYDGAGGAEYDLGVVFDATWFAGISPQVINIPSPPAIATFVALSGVINVPGGFIDSCSLYYVLKYTNLDFTTGTWAIYDGADGTGNLLFSDTVETTGYENWVLISASFSGVARSLVFTALEALGQWGVDNFKIGPPP